MADAQDSKSCVGDYVWVQVPSSAWFKSRDLENIMFSRFFMVLSQ